MWQRHPLAARLTLFVLLPLLGGGGWGWNWLRQSLPPQEVIFLTDGVAAPVKLSRDEHGAVQIEASNDHDAFYAVGFAQAQDRLWQLELQRRMVRGRLSEVFGKDSIDTDVWFRTLGLPDSARSVWPALSAPARASLSAYAAGINAAIARTATLPPEFQIFGIRPEPWTEIDSLAWMKMFAFDLGGNFRREIDRHLADGVLAPDQSSVFFPGYPVDAPTTVAAATDDEALAAVADWHDRLQRKWQVARPGTGSNVWAVAGRLTASGGALLANDLHLGLQIPSRWYAISINTPTLKVAGMSLVGLPIVVLGRNDRIAWGGTNMMADTQDLYIERTNADGKRYWAEGAWQVFQVQRERIRVRADFPERLHRPYVPVELKVRRSRHGPIISDRFGVFDAPVALRWTGLDEADTSYDAFFRLGYAQDWGQFVQALSRHVAPAMNMLYADRDGNIGYLGAGRIPVRGRGQGAQPAPGWDPAYRWSGEVPPAQWPQAYNPPSGYLVNANNRIVGMDYPYFVSHDWASPARARRIEQLLRELIEADRKLSVEDMQRIQADTLDLDAAALMQVLRKSLPRYGRAAQAATYLEHWNGDMRADSQAAAIFHAWIRHVRERLFDARLRGTWSDSNAAGLLHRLSDGVGPAQLAALLEDNGRGWCRNGGVAADDCTRLLADALSDALAELHKLLGDWSMHSWQWGDVQQTLYAHTPLSGIKPLRRIFERHIGSGGSIDSIAVAGSRFVEGQGYLQDFGAGFRQVIELAPARTTHDYMNSTGQSGNVLSRHYDDMIEPFRDVRYYRLAGPGEAASNPATATTMAPAQTHTTAATP